MYKTKPFAAILALCLVFLCGCSKHEVSQLVLWVSDKEFVRYVEMFNASHENIKVILVYKENPAASMPPQNNESVPDVIAGAWLRTEQTSRNFKKINNLFNDKFPEKAFYSQLLDAGKIGRKQYLLPLSFNLPAMIFSQENASRLPDSYTISIDQIREASREFNERKEDMISFSKIGFTLLDSSNFLYFTARAMDADFHKTKTGIAWNDEKLSNSVAYLRNWLAMENGGPTVESNFSYKYLSMPAYHKVNTGRCLFAYIKSNDLFSLSADQISTLDYRWISNEGKLPVEDSLNMIGITKKSKHVSEAKYFIKWLLSVETQRKIIELKTVSKLDTDTFGIAGGFSSLWEVNEQILPVHYTILLSNIPQSQALQIPNKLPPLWDIIEDKVVMPYLLQVCTAENSSSITNLEERYAVWERQKFN